MLRGELSELNNKGLLQEPMTMMMGSWRLQTLAKVLFSRCPLELSLTFRCAKWVRAQKPKASYQTFCARTHCRHAIPLWPFKGSILCRSLTELYLLTESFVYEKTPNHNTKKNRSLGEGTKLTLHTPPLMFGCFLQLPKLLFVCIFVVRV